MREEEFISHWEERGKIRGALWLIVAKDIEDHDIYPLFVHGNSYDDFLDAYNWAIPNILSINDLENDVFDVDLDYVKRVCQSQEGGF